MGTPLTGNPISSTYPGWLKTTDNAALTAVLRTITDGLGNDSALQVSTAGIKSTGTLTVAGTTTLTGAVTAPAGVTGPVTGATTGAHNGTVGATTPNTGAFTTITASGAATFNGAANVNAGVQFPAVQVLSADANNLDDYEEGTWTPTLGGSATYTTQTGRYTKIGRIVNVSGRLAVNSIGTGSTGTISGLPFTAGSDSAAAIGYFQNLNTTGYVSVYAYVVSGSSTIQTCGMASGADGVTSPGNFFKSGTDVIFSATYSV